MGNKISWEELLDKLKTTHTVSIKDICMELKCSRTWANRYVVPFVDKVSLDTGVRRNRQVGFNWLKYASKELGRELNGSVYLNEEEYRQWILSHISSITRRTRKVPVDALVLDPELFNDGWIDISQSIRDLGREGKYSEQFEQIQKRTEFMKRMLKPGVAEFLKKWSDRVESEPEAGHPHIVQRGEAKRVDCRQEEEDRLPPISEWQALHDVVHYGDTTEEHLRKFFRNGFIRIVVSIPDSKGRLSEKIYYADINQPELSGSFFNLLIEESVYPELKSLLD